MLQQRDMRPGGTSPEALQFAMGEGKEVFGPAKS